MSEFKDLFSKQSGDYAKFRPTYPDDLFRYLASLVEEHELAWDIGTGNSQAAVKLADRFKRVVATDPSAKQISSASPHPHVSYEVGSSESSSLPESSVSLITVAQAFHWFKQAEFFAEAKRVLSPGGVLGIWSYALAEISPEIDAVVYELYQETLGAYWEPERKLVEEGYKSVQLPFPEIQPPAFEMRAEWSLEHLAGYLSTWSALQSFIQKNASNPPESFYPKLKIAWGSTEIRPVRWALSVRIGRNSKK